MSTSRFRRWRVANGYSLRDVEDLTGLSSAMLSRAERGERSLAPATKVRVARLLGVHVSDLWPVDELDDEAASV